MNGKKRARPVEWDTNDEKIENADQFLSDIMASAQTELLNDAFLHMRLDQQASIKHRKTGTAENAIQIINQHFEKLNQLQWVSKQQQKRDKLFRKNMFISNSCAQLPSSISSPLVPYEYEQPNHFQVCLRKPYTLYPFQTEAIKWMLQIEQRIVQNPNFHEERTGGILALTMGQGKTLCAGTLVAHSLQQQRQEGSCSLYVCPLGVMDVARFEMEKFFGDQLRIMLYHPDYAKNRFEHMGPAQFKQFDMIITNYDTLKSRAKQFSAFMLFPWFRIILDESHAIQNKKTKCFQSANALIAPRRWCMTGTPIQNNLSDLFYQLYFCGLNEVAVGRTRMNKESINKLGLHRFIYWKTEDDVETVQLPPVETEIVSFDMNPLEQKLHYYLVSHSRKILEDNQNDLNLQKKQKTLQINNNLLRGLLMSTAGYLMTPQAKHLVLGIGITDDHKHHQAFKLFGSHQNTDGDSDTKTLEYGSFNSSTTSPAWMSMALDPIGGDPETISEQETLQHDEGEDVPSNMEFLTPYQEVQRWVKDKYGTAGIFSTKMIQIVEKWKQIQQQEPGAKVLIFSNFASPLQLAIESMIHHIPQFAKQYVFVHGKSGAPHIRTAKMQRFINDPSVLALFATTLVAGRGFNLTCANYIMFIDVWWNHTRQTQAIGRMKRIGQTKKMHAIYFLANKSLDAHVYKRALQKQELSEDVRAMNKEQMRLSDAEMRSIWYQHYVGDVEMVAAETAPVSNESMVRLNAPPISSDSLLPGMVSMKAVAIS